ncbi:hypothetical protein [Salinivibrio phage CW02]|uniref:Uncharacterized protein n=1 Tax=Salinivibrio phage CW02 TaxID=1161935 RepID=H9D1D0_9CAUD|nr:hypothetical protein F490_gp65 [Salinivibrio phage CW02]AFE86172.1 hypothetical protein [Salinivibrio phage CW02]
MTEFKKGQKVLCHRDYLGNPEVRGKTGVVRYVDGGVVGVEFPFKMGVGHGLSDLCEYGYGWYVMTHYLSPVILEENV